MELAKRLGLVHVFCIAAGAMISSGLFVLPGLAHARSGPAVIFSYALAGFLALGGLFSIAELTTAMPRAGGDYFYISRGMGPAVGTAAGLLSWFSLSLKSAFAIFGLAVLLQPVIGIDYRIIGILASAIFVGINLLGVKEAARFQVALVFALLALLAAFIILGFTHINITKLSPFAPYGLKSVFATTGFVFVSYGGLMQIASIAGEVKQPGKVIPYAMASALLVVTILYVLTVLVTSGVMETQALDTSRTPISDAAAIFMGRPGEILIAIAALLAFLTTANAGIMAASRYLFALSGDGLMPQNLSKLTKRFKTPYVAVLTTGIIVTLAMFIKLDILVEAGSIVFILGYILSSVTVIILRESRIHNYRPSFKAPFYPWLQIISVIGFAFVLIELGEEGYLITAFIVLAAFAIYWLYGRSESNREYALLGLVERITATDKELLTGSLESELKDIIRERDSIELDRFDNLLENGSVLDLTEPQGLNDLFEKVSQELAPRLQIDAQTLAATLSAREQAGSTALSSVLAVPHAIVPGNHIFDVCLVRCEKGVRFSDRSPAIKIIFVLVGSPDERNFYLRALAAIAQIVQEKGFDKKWMAATNKQGLRDTVLLARRGRQRPFSS